MRSLLLSAAFLLFSLCCFSQAKNDRKITVTPSDTAKLFDKLITLLYAENYTIKTEDKQRGILITDEKTLDANLSPQVRLKLQLKNGTVEVTGDVKPGVDINFGSIKYNAALEPIKNHGAKGSLYRSAWNEMDRVAKLIGTTTYSK